MRKFLVSCLHGNKYKSTHSDVVHAPVFDDLSFLEFDFVGNVVLPPPA